MNSDCVDLIYLDPPFNSNRAFDAPIGSSAEGAGFDDIWKLSDIDKEEHGLLADKEPAVYSIVEASRRAYGPSMMSYLMFMALRLMEMKRILSPSGSIYLHCDPTASHYLKCLMDGIFGKTKFRNEIVWCYTGPSVAKRDFPRKRDTILSDVMGDEWTFNADDVRVPYTKLNTNKGGKMGGEELDPKLAEKYAARGKVPESWWSKFSPVGRLKNELTGYPTQKPLKLLNRIISASSNKNDLVFDPFCGCATALVSADRLGRQWIGCDLSPKAVELVDMRIAKDRGALAWGGCIALETPPTRTDQGKLPPARRHAHRLYGEQEGNCIGCDLHFPFKVMEVDHILPRSKGGTDAPENLQMLCCACNRSKGDDTMAAWETRRGW